MDVYIYQADIYCAACASEIKSSLTDDTGDSDDYPQGPYADGGGEADFPQHCGHCGVFLENPLTTDGIEYVRNALKHMPSSRLQEWADFYSDVL